MAPRARDITGQRFGLLVAVRRTDRLYRREAYWRCRCECGKEKDVTYSSLARGFTRSCGCASGRWSSQARQTHGHASRGTMSPEYSSWQSIFGRCERPSHKSFPCYGGRGIKVCARWRTFENFLADMGPRPSREHSIDRRDNDGNYEPGNCRWATRVEQAANRKTSKLLTFKGRTQTVKQWERELGFGNGTVWGRLKRGWSVEAALARPTMRGAA